MPAGETIPPAPCDQLVRMRPQQSSVIPVKVLRGFASRDDATREWAARVSVVALDLLQRWELHPEGTVRSGEAGVLVPVRRADGSPAALKLQVPRAETTAAIIGLTRWQGAGIVRLLDSDAARGGMLLERLHGDRTLETVEDDDAAIRVVGGLLARLHAAAAPDGLPRLATVATEMVADAPAAARALDDDDDRSRLDRWVDTVSAMADDTGDRLLHWDLHYGNVLAADREPWLAIDPEPLVGDPGFDLWPALDSGWSDDHSRTDAPRLVQRRFDILTEMLDLDRRRAAVWTRARLLQNTLWDIEDGQPAISAAARLVDDALLAAHSSGD